MELLCSKTSNGFLPHSVKEPKFIQQPQTLHHLATCSLSTASSTLSPSLILLQPHQAPYYSLYMSSFQFTQALHLLFLLPRRFFHRYFHGSLLYLFHMSTPMSPYQRNLPWQSHIKWFLLWPTLSSNFLALLRFSLLLSTVWNNSIYVFIVCVPQKI